MKNNERKVFVYGTLKNGGKWHHLMSEADFIGSDTIEGELYLASSGYYPILFRGRDNIQGEVYLVTESVLTVLIQMEGEADFNIEEVKTSGGITVLAFYFNDKTQRVKERKIDNFDAEYYFFQWLKMTPKDSDSYAEFVNFGKKTK